MEPLPQPVQALAPSLEIPGTPKRFFLQNNGTGNKKTTLREFVCLVKPQTERCTIAIPLFPGLRTPILEERESVSTTFDSASCNF